MQMKLFPGPVIAWYPQGPSTRSYDLFLFFLTVELLVAKGLTSWTVDSDCSYTMHLPYPNSEVIKLPVPVDLVEIGLAFS